MAGPEGSRRRRRGAIDASSDRALALETERLQARSGRRRAQAVGLVIAALVGGALALLANVGYGLALTALALIGLVLLGLIESMDRGRLKVVVDESILRDESAAQTPAARARAERLNRPRFRTLLAGNLEDVVHLSEDRGLESIWLHAHRPTVLANRDLLLRIAARLRAPEPVSAAPLLRLDRLLRDPLGPLYRRDQTDEFRTRMEAIERDL